MRQHIIIVTGHIGSGKSTLFKHLEELYQNSIKKIDIRQIHQNHPDCFSPSKKGERRHNYLQAAVMTALFQGLVVYIEVVGTEPWFLDFLQTISQLHVPLIQVELKRSSIQVARQAIRQRNGDDAELTHVEAQHLEEHYGFIFNNNARLFSVNNDITVPLLYVRSILEKE